MAQKIDDVHELVAITELETIVVHEERARRLRWTESELTDKSFPETTSSLGIGRDETKFRYRFRTRFTDENGEYVADFEATYVVADPIEVAEAILQEFAGRVAFMAVYPFIRASIFGSASRLGLPIPVLGLVRQGEFEAGEPMTPDQVQEEFMDNRSETAPEI